MKDRFLIANMDFMLDDDGSIVFVESVSKAYIMDDVLDQNVPSSASFTSPFRGKSPKECSDLLDQICNKTESIIILHIFAIMNEESLRNDIAILIKMEDDWALSRRCEFRIACARLNQYYIGDASIYEDL